MPFARAQVYLLRLPLCAMSRATMLSLAALTLAVVMPHLAQARCMTDDAVESFFTGDVRPSRLPFSHNTSLLTVSFDVDLFGYRWCSSRPRATARRRAAFRRANRRLRPFICPDPFRYASSVTLFSTGTEGRINVFAPDAVSSLKVDWPIRLSCSLPPRAAARRRRRRPPPREYTSPARPPPAFCPLRAAKKTTGEDA